MKTIITTIALFLSTMTYAQNTLTVHITELKTNKGTVWIQLFDANKNVVSETKAKVTNLKTTVVFENLPSATYAIQYYHDENDNGKLDTGMFGKPEEGYGYSNDARGFFGPAEFEDQLFEIKEDLTITLKTV